MKNIKNILSAIDSMQDCLYQSILIYIESNGTITIPDENLGDTEHIDVYVKDGVSRERVIRSVLVSDEKLHIIAADIHNGGEDATVPVSDDILRGVVDFLEFCAKLNDGEDKPSLLEDCPMLFVCKSDLIAAGFDITNVTDEVMRDLAIEMADCYSDEEFVEHLNDCASNLDIPRNKLSVIEYLMENGSSRYVAEEYVTDSWDWDISKDDNLERFLADMKNLGVKLNN